MSILGFGNLFWPQSVDLGHLIVNFGTLGVLWATRSRYGSFKVHLEPLGLKFLVSGSQCWVYMSRLCTFRVDFGHYPYACPGPSDYPAHAFRYPSRTGNLPVQCPSNRIVTSNRPLIDLSLESVCFCFHRETKVRTGFLKINTPTKQ